MSLLVDHPSKRKEGKFKLEVDNIYTENDNLHNEATLETELHSEPTSSFILPPTKLTKKEKEVS